MNIKFKPHIATFIPYSDQDATIFLTYISVKLWKSFLRHVWDDIDTGRAKIAHKIIGSLEINRVSYETGIGYARNILKKLKGLKKLKLGNLNNSSARKCAISLKAFKYLIKFSYEHILNYMYVEKGFTFLLRNISFLKRVESLSVTLPGGTITERNIGKLNNFLRNLKDIEQLDLNFQELYTLGQRRTAILLPIAENLRHLKKLRKFSIKPTFVPILNKFYITMIESLYELDGLRDFHMVMDTDPFCLDYYKAAKNFITAKHNFEMVFMAINWRFDTCEQLVDLFTNFEKLKHLSLMPVFAIEDEQDTEDWHLISEAFSYLVNLEILVIDFEFCQVLTTFLLDSIGDAFAAENKIKSCTLKMRGQEMGLDFNEELKYFLETLKDLREFYIFASNNYFVNDYFLEMLGESLTAFPQIEKFRGDFSRCDISNTGFKALCKHLALNENFKLIGLEISDTRVSKKGIKGLIRLIQSQKRLQTLDLNLSTIGISKEVMDDVVKAIRNLARSLIFLKLDLEQLDYSEFSEIKDTLKKFFNPLIMELLGDEFSDFSSIHQDCIWIQFLFHVFAQISLALGKYVEVRIISQINNGFVQKTPFFLKIKESEAIRHTNLNLLIILFNYHLQNPSRYVPYELN